MKKLFAAAALLLATVAQAQAPAAEPNWEVRFRAVQVNFAHSSTDEGVVAKNDIYVSNKVIPEVDISYIVNPYVSAELILTYPQRLDVYSGTLGRVGTVDALPPCLTLQGHYPIGPVNPYVGVGANLTLFTAQNLASKNIEVDSTSFGFVGQAGFDLAVPGLPITLNADVKYVTMQTKVKAKHDLLGGAVPAGTKIADIKPNPLLIGVGLAYKF